MTTNLRLSRSTSESVGCDMVDIEDIVDESICNHCEHQYECEEQMWGAVYCLDFVEEEE